MEVAWEEYSFLNFANCEQVVFVVIVGVAAVVVVFPADEKCKSN